LKCINFYVLIFLFFISCDDKSDDIKKRISENELQLLSIEKNKNDSGFQLKNGVLYFNDNPYSGAVHEFYDHKVLKSISRYYLGKKEGEYVGFYPNQKKWFERFYSRGIKVKTHNGWYQNGQQMFEYQFNNLGAYHGYVKDWHSNGQLAKHFNFENGQEVGSQKMWTSTGKIRANFFTVNGERHGLIGLKNCVSVTTTK